MFRTIEYQSENGLSVLLGDKPPYILNTKPGDTLSSASQVVMPPGQDGADEYNITRRQRSIFIEGMIIAEGNKNVSVQTELDRLRKRLTSVFDPRRTGVLIYNTADGRYRLSRCRSPSTPQYGKCVQNILPFVIELTSGDSLWESDTRYSLPLGTAYFNLRFPLFIPDEGFPMDVEFMDAIINNDTTLDIKPVIDVFDTSGAHVTVVNETTGTYITVSHDVQEHQKMTIDVANATVKLFEKDGDNWKLVDNNILNWMTPDSDLTSFVIVPGINSFTINDDLPGVKPIMTIFWRIPYVGV